MMVDVQCIMPALQEITSCYHTKLVTTSSKAHFPGVTHVEFDTEHAYEVAKSIIKMGVENFSNRNKDKVNIPKHEMDLVAGFTKEGVFHMLGGKYRASYRPLNEAIISGKIRGLAGVVGCNNPKHTHDYFHTTLVKELIRTTSWFYRPAVLPSPAPSKVCLYRRLRSTPAMACARYARQ